MGTEEQTQAVHHSVTYGGNEWGQRLTIDNRVISKLSLKLEKTGSPTGALWYRIRRVSDGSAVVSKQLDAADVPVSVDWMEATFDTPTLFNEEVRIMVGLIGGDVSNCVKVYSSYPDDVKADEYITFRSAAGAYTDYTSWDFTYIYTYVLSQEHGGGLYPVDDMSRVSSNRHIFRPGLFAMQVGLGDLGFDVDVAETAVRVALDTTKEVGVPFRERMEATAKLLQEATDMSRGESLRIARKLETLEDITRREGIITPPPAPTGPVTIGPPPSEYVPPARIYTCPHCGTGFASAQLMWEHIAASHPEHPGWVPR